jgi:type VI secretion system secreted protein Hcp
MNFFLLQPGDPDLFDGDPTDGLEGMPEKDATFDPGLCVPLISVTQGLKQSVTTDVGNAARTAGRPIVGDFTLVRFVDALSVRLYQYCLEVRSLGAGPERPTYLHMLSGSDGAARLVLTFALRDAILSEVQFQSHPDQDTPTEQLALNFTEILWHYRIEKGGRPIGELRTGWSVVGNRPIASFTT